LRLPIMVDFKGGRSLKEVILYAVFFYVLYPVSYRDLEDITAERGVAIDDGTLNRWVVKFAACLPATPSVANSYRKEAR
jgi:putative transposase